MATRYGKRIVTDGLVLCLDAADNISAPHDDLPVKQGLVGWWDANDDSTVTMNGSYVSELRDKSGNGYHMTPSGATLNQGPLRNTTLNSKKVLYFNSNGRGLGTASGDLNLTSTNYTVIALSRYTNAGGSYDNRVVQAVGNNWLLGHHGSYIKRYYANGWVSTNSTAGDNNFHTYVGTGDISNDFYNFWVDSGNVTGNAGGSQGPNGLSVNAGYDTSESSECELAELIVFNRVITNDERKKIETYISNKWNRSLSDAKWYDRTANAYDGTPTNEPIYSKINKGSFEFDGSDTNINLTSHSSAFDFGTGNFSVEAWVNGAISSNFRCIFWHHYNPGFSLITTYGQSPDGAPRFWLGGTVLNGTTSILDDTWHHVLVTRDGATVTIYIDGAQNVSNAGFSGKSATPSTAQAAIGQYNVTSSSYPFDGKIAVVRIYNKALSAAEVSQSYNATKGRYTALGTASNPAESAAQILASDSTSPNGVYWIKPSGYSGSAQLIYCDMSRGGWMLVASNDASDTTIPGGTSRNSLTYALNRNGTNGALGTPDPNKDYIIGNIIDSLSFSSVKVIGWGRGSTNGTYFWNGDQNNLGSSIIAEWNLSSSGSSRRTEVVARANVTLSGSTTLHGSASYFVLDAVACDSGLNANSNQSTVGGAGVANSSGDPSNGTYLGHGSSEGSYEGWYISGGGAGDSQGYTTWVK